MQIISAQTIFLCDEKFTILKNKAILFDEKILEIDNLSTLQKKYPNANYIQTPKNSILLPAFINPHTHLEFSANSTTLHYGNFITWLKSVINSRDQLNENAKYNLIQNTLKQMLKTGTSTLGEISSFGSDLMACANSPMRIIFFNEILGSMPTQNEEKKKNFSRRLEASLKLKNDLFIPAISVHSPYSTNIELAYYAIQIAKENNLLLSTHLLESKDENLWLRNKKGAFKTWLSGFTSQTQPMYTIEQYISLFKNQRTLFTHCVFLKELELLDKNLHSITHCAFSNRLLSEKSLSLNKIFKNKINIHLGTDGLSSNISLSMLDEMRANLLVHQNFDLTKLAKKLLLMATLYPAQAINLNLGEIKKGKIADFSIFKLDNNCDEKQIALQFILHAKKVEKIFIKGRECKF